MAQWLYIIYYSTYVCTVSTKWSVQLRIQAKKRGFLYTNCPAGRPLLPVGSQPLTEQVQRGRRLPLFGSQYIDGRIPANSSALRKPVNLSDDLLPQRIPLQFGSTAGTPPASPALIQGRN